MRSNGSDELIDVLQLNIWRHNLWLIINIIDESPFSNFIFCADSIFVNRGFFGVIFSFRKSPPAVHDSIFAVFSSWSISTIWPWAPGSPNESFVIMSHSMSNNYLQLRMKLKLIDFRVATKVSRLRSKKNRLEYVYPISINALYQMD